MKVLKFLLWIVLLAVLATGCNKRVKSPTETMLPDSVRINIPVFGNGTSLEVITWNMENFPKLNMTTVTTVSEIISDLDADIYGMQEIADTSSFRKLLNLLPDYSGVYSSDDYGSSYQKTAVIYRKNLVTLNGRTSLFPGDSYAFPRPPLQVSLSAVNNGHLFDFNLIVLHLKAFDGADERARRRRACELLKEYLDEKIANGPEKQFIVVGDWNDQLNDPPSTNVFQVFLQDSADYRFLTQPLSATPTYIAGSYKSAIDHILISADILPEYQGGKTSVIKVDNYYNGYVTNVSDHRPVGAIFPVF
ncbi:MAG: endonuclease/exonuclease/phosphatase family protein [Calditrichia bacterium]